MKSIFFGDVGIGLIVVSFVEDHVLSSGLKRAMNLMLSIVVVVGAAGTTVVCVTTGACVCVGSTPRQPDAVEEPSVCLRSDRELVVC